jgi:hypothetical protein
LRHRRGGRRHQHRGTAKGQGQHQGQGRRRKQRGSLRIHVPSPVEEWGRVCRRPRGILFRTPHGSQWDGPN